MQQQPVNPFIQHALQHGQLVFNEANRAITNSQSLIPACDDIIQSINSGNTQRAAAVAQNLKLISEQLYQSTQLISNNLNQRVDMISYVLNRAQQNITELTGAIHTLRNPQTGYNSISYTQPVQPITPPYTI